MTTKIKDSQAHESTVLFPQYFHTVHLAYELTLTFTPSLFTNETFNQAVF